MERKTMGACIPPHPSFSATPASSSMLYVISKPYSSTVIFDDVIFDYEILLFDFDALISLFAWIDVSPGYGFSIFDFYFVLSCYLWGFLGGVCVQPIYIRKLNYRRLISFIDKSLFRFGNVRDRARITNRTLRMGLHLL